MNHSGARTAGGIEFLHEAALNCEMQILAVPEIFQTAATAPGLEISLIGSRELSVDNGNKRYLLTAIASRVLNACLYLPETRQQSFEAEYILRFGLDQTKYPDERLVLNPNALMRAVDAFDEIRSDMDGGAELIKRSVRGSGNHTKYQLAADVYFTDKRQAQ